MRSSTFLLAALLLALPATAATVNEVQKLLASDASAGDKFGLSVAASADVLVVGAPEKDILFGTLVEAMGAAYVFTRDANNEWEQTARLTPIDGGTPGVGGSSAHGYSVAVSGDTVFVGAPGERAVYVYTRDGAGGWPHFQKIPSPGSDVGDLFGHALAASGNRLVVGAPQSAYFFEYDSVKGLWELVGDFTSPIPSSAFGTAVAIDADTAVIGAMGDDFLGPAAGAAHVYAWNGEKWVSEALLRPDDLAAGYEFGHSVSVSGNSILVSASRFLLGADGAGKSYRYERTGGIWQLRDELLAADASPAGEFGWSVALQDNAAIVTDSYYDGPAVNSGRAYVFTPSASGDWQRSEILEASDAELSDGFGSWAAIAGNTFLVGAWGEDEGGITAGAAYVFELNLEVPAVPAMNGTGTLLCAGAILALGAFHLKSPVQRRRLQIMSVSASGSTKVAGSRWSTWPKRPR